MNPKGLIEARAIKAYYTGTEKWEVKDELVQLQPPVFAGWRVMIFNGDFAVGDAFNDNKGRVLFPSPEVAMQNYAEAPVSDPVWLPQWNEAIRPMVKDATTLPREFVFIGAGWPHG